MKQLSKELKLATTPTHRAESDTRALTELFQKCLVILGTNAPIGELARFEIKKKQKARH